MMPSVLGEPGAGAAAVAGALLAYRSELTIQRFILIVSDGTTHQFYKMNVLRYFCPSLFSESMARRRS